MSFKFLPILFTILALSACSPKDAPLDGENGGRPGGTDLSSFTTDVETVSKTGDKLSTCSEDGKPTWDTIRFFHELNFIYPAINNNELTVIVSKGDFNCVRVGDKVELVTQKEPRGQDYEKTGSFVYVQKIEMMDTGYLLSQSSKLMEYAEGMGMTSGQLSSYLRDRARDKVNITFISKNKKTSSGGGSDDPVVDGDDDSSSSSFTILKSDGEKTANCGNQTWKGLRLQTWFIDEHKSKMIENFENKSIKVFVGAGDKQCLPVGAQGQYESLNAEDSFELMGDKFTVQSIVVRPKSDLLEDPILMEYLAEDMGLSLEMFTEHVENMRNDNVNMTFLSWEEEQ